MQKDTEKPKFNSVLIAIIFLISGITLFALSVFSGSTLLSFIGLGLTFWGALFLLMPPPKHVEASFLITSTLPTYMNIDRMLNSLIPKNEAYNIPPCPKGVNLPDHLKGLKEMVTFIPAEHTDGIAEIEDIARGKFLVEKPKGLLIISPGVSLLGIIEEKHNKDFTKIPLSELDETLPELFSELHLANEIEMTTNENDIILQINGSLYKNLYNQKYNLKSISLLGCPLVNAVGCAIAKSTGKPTMIQETKTAQNGKTITVIFNIVQAKKEPVDFEYWEGLPEEKSEVLEQPIPLEASKVLEEEKSVGLLVTKAEVSGNTVKFFVEKGFLKKRWVVVKEIPVYEITNVENFGNKLNITWKNVTATFFTKENVELFSNLRDEVNRILMEQPKPIDEGKIALRRNELLGVINASIGIIDFSFNILIGLQNKGINWERLEEYSSKDLIGAFTFIGQSMPPLNLSFLNIASAIKSQIPEETSREAYKILKVIYGYFDSLNVDDDLKESSPNFKIARDIILSYFTLNELLLGKEAGEKENNEKNSQLERVIQILANNTNFKINIEQLKASIDKVVPENNLESVIDSSRKIFKDQFLVLVYKPL